MKDFRIICTLTEYTDRTRKDTCSRTTCDCQVFGMWVDLAREENRFISETIYVDSNIDEDTVSITQGTPPGKGRTPREHVARLLHSWRAEEPRLQMQATADWDAYRVSAEDRAIAMTRADIVESILTCNR
jgi:hypothetical protein